MIKVHKNILIDIDNVRSVTINDRGKGKWSLLFEFTEGEIILSNFFDSYKEAEEHFKEIEKLVCKDDVSDIGLKKDRCDDPRLNVELFEEWLKNLYAGAYEQWLEKELIEAREERDSLRFASNGG